LGDIFWYFEFNEELWERSSYELKGLINERNAGTGPKLEP